MTATMQLETERVAENLPTMTGTPKQVAWAEDIRVRRVPEIVKLLNRKLEGLDEMTEDHRETSVRVTAEVDHVMAEAISSHTEARWWIDQRDLTPVQLMDGIRREARRAAKKG